MKEELINIIKILGIGLNELYVEIDLGFLYIHSIEYVKEDNSIILHNFIGDLDVEFDYVDLEEYEKIYIFSLLSAFL